MRTATVRQVQHHLSDVLRSVEDGEAVLITRRGRVIAKIIPARDESKAVVWPDFMQRATRVWGGRIRGKAVGSLIIEERKDRV